MALGLSTSDIRRIAWTAVFAFVAVFGSLATGAADFHNFSDARAAVLALVPTAIAAALSAIKNGILADSSPVK